MFFLLGVLTFGFWFFGSVLLFDNQTSSGIKSSVWLLCGGTILLGISAIVCTVFLFKTKEENNSSNNLESENKKLIISVEGTYEKEGLLGVLKRAAPMCGLMFLLMLTTLFLFPTFGPIGWYEAKVNDYRTINNGTSYPRSYDVERTVLIVSFLNRFLQFCILAVNYVLC